MIDNIISAITGFTSNAVEIKTWGYNWDTIGALGTGIFTILQAYGMYGQNKKIWGNKSADSVSGLFFAYLFFYLVSFVFYGVYRNSLAMVFNSLLLLFTAPIFWGIYKFKKLKTWKIILTGILPLMVTFMIMVEDKELLFSLYLFGLVPFLIIQIWEMFKSNDRGDAHLVYFFVFLGTSIFWLILSWKKGWLSIMIFNILAILLYESMIAIYFIKPKKI